MDTEKNILDFDVIISTCDKFSDLWDANVLLLNQNWKERGKNTYLVTDRKTEKKFEGVEVICAGEGMEITQRLATVLKNIKSKYILFTLDDYFLTRPIDNEKIRKAIEFMDRENIDYVRLFSATKRYLNKEGANAFENDEGFYLRNISKGNYKISLYPGLWKTEFMRKTVGESLNAWQYEVALTPMARKLNARCAISNNNEFPFMDVIRKGKILRKANKYFKKNQIYMSDRKVMSWGESFKFSIRAFLHTYLPKPLFGALKRFLIRRGETFYTPLE